MAAFIAEVPSRGNLTIRLYINLVGAYNDGNMESTNQGVSLSVFVTGGEPWRIL